MLRSMATGTPSSVRYEREQRPGLRPAGSRTGLDLSGQPRPFSAGHHPDSADDVSIQHEVGVRARFAETDPLQQRPFLLVLHALSVTNTMTVVMAW